MMQTWVMAAIATMMFVVAACGNSASPREDAILAAKGSRTRIPQLCPKCEILYQNAVQDSAVQQNTPDLNSAGFTTLPLAQCRSAERSLTLDVAMVRELGTRNLPPADNVPGVEFMDASPPGGGRA